MPSEIIRIPDRLIRRVQRIARRECANCDKGNCLLLDDGETCVCPQRISRSLWCRYLVAAVLPAHRELYNTLMNQGGRKRCAECGQPFRPTSNRAAYCDACRLTVQRRRIRERVQRFRGAT